MGRPWRLRVAAEARVEAECANRRPRPRERGLWVELWECRSGRKGYRHGCKGAGKMSLKKAMDEKVKVKPVVTLLVHSAAYEGPCRVGPRESLTPEADERRGQEAFERFIASLREGLGGHAEMLQPALYRWKDDFVITDESFAEIEKDVHQADAIVVHTTGLGQYPAIAMAHRYGLPIITIGQVGAVDIVAYLRSRGMDAWAVYDVEDLNELLRLLYVRKALARTRVLIVTNNNLLPLGVVSSIDDLTGLRMRFGVDHRLRTVEELLEHMRNLAPEAAAEAEQLTRELIQGAEQSDMTFEQLLPSVRFYVAVKRMLEMYDCNAFTIPCFEICATRVMEQERVTFCLAHTLLKDEGIPSACEGDVNVLLSIAVLMYLSGKSPHMGNTSVVDRAENIIAVHHDVPGLKMKGLEGERLPYGIKNFTVGGWGGTLRYDISRDVGEPVTILRFNPLGDSFIAAVGEVVGCQGYMDVGCSLQYRIRIEDADEFYRCMQDYGHHFALVFGDYGRELERLAEVLKVGAVIL